MQNSYMCCFNKLPLKQTKSSLCYYGNGCYITILLCNFFDLAAGKLNAKKEICEINDTKVGNPRKGKR